MHHYQQRDGEGDRKLGGKTRVNASSRSRVGVGMNRYVREGKKCVRALSGPTDWILRYIQPTLLPFKRDMESGGGKGGGAMNRTKWKNDVQYHFGDTG